MSEYNLVNFKTGEHYAATTVPFDKSLSQIKTLLQQHGCTKIAVQEDTAGEFPLVTLLFMKDSLPDMIQFPVTYLEKSKKGRELKMEISGRIIHDRVKALLIEVDIHMADFSQAMMRFIALPSSDGQLRTLENVVLEQRDRIAGGNFDIAYLPPAKN
jgi:hypothetical protein